MTTRRMALLTGTALLLTVLSACSGPPPPEFPHEDALYIWQRVWNEDTRASVAKAVDVADHLMVLALEAETAPIRVDWAALDATGRPVTLVFRYPRLAADEGRVARVRADIEEALAAASAQDVQPVGLQLDFDSPTSKLAEYRGLIVALKPTLPSALDLSITALPTWLGSPEFPRLAGELAYYVLQVHSFEPPQSVETPLVLCDTAKLDGYIAKASALGVPYFVAFPTHGYEVAYDGDGQFAGLTAEGALPGTWPPDHQTREVRAEPEAIAAAVARLRAQPPAWYRGNVWFRMPVATDTRNWSWPTLAAVLEGRAPTRAYRAEVRHPDPGLAEIWLANTGEDRAALPVGITLSISARDVLAYDCVNGFTAHGDVDEGKVILRGLAPVSEAGILVAWYRMQDAGAAEGIMVASTGEGQ